MCMCMCVHLCVCVCVLLFSWFPASVYVCIIIYVYVCSIRPVYGRCVCVCWGAITDGIAATSQEPYPLYLYVLPESCILITLYVFPESCILITLVAGGAIAKHQTGRHQRLLHRYPRVCAIALFGWPSWQLPPRKGGRLRMPGPRIDAVAQVRPFCFTSLRTYPCITSAKCPNNHSIITDTPQRHVLIFTDPPQRHVLVITDPPQWHVLIFTDPYQRFPYPLSMSWIWVDDL
jgi:hypothetical protein